MPLPLLLLIALLLLASCGGSGTSTTPAPAAPAAPPPPRPPARVFGCVTDITPTQNPNGVRLLRTYLTLAVEARTLPASLFTTESLHGGTPTWNSVVWKPDQAATRFGAVRDGERILRGSEVEPVLRNPENLQVALRPAGATVYPFRMSVGAEGEPYLLPAAARSLLASREDESWSIALTDDGEVGSAVFDDPVCAPPE